MKTVEEIAEIWEFNWCQPSGLDHGQREALVKAITAYADEKLEEAVGCVTDNPSRTVNRIRALKSTGSVSDTPAPGGAK